MEHQDQYTPWKSIKDASVILNKINSVYYRIQYCTVVERETQIPVHKLALIEIKAPDDIYDFTGNLSGFLVITGKIRLKSGGSSSLINDTTRQFFLVSRHEPLFTVEVPFQYVEIDNIYLNVFESDISSVYSPPKDENEKTVRVIDFSKPASQSSKNQKNNINDNQVMEIFNLFFGPGLSDELEINESDRVTARILVTELIKGSCSFAVVDGMKDFHPDIKSLSESLFKMTSNCYDSKRKGRYYEAVRSAIALKYKSLFLSRKATGQW